MFLFFSKATGSQLGTLIEISVSVLMSLIIAFAYSWVLSLLVLGVVPFVVITVFLQAKALSGYAKQKSKASEKSGEVRKWTLSEQVADNSFCLAIKYYMSYT